MKTTITGLIPSTLLHFRASLRHICFACACLFAVTGHATVDDWPVSASALYQDHVEVMLVAQTVTAPAAFGCHGLVQVSVAQNGKAAVTAAMIVSDPQYPLDQYSVDIMGPLTDTVTCAEIGQEVMVVVEDPTGNICMSQLIVEDKLKPVMVCSDDTIPCYSDLLDLDYLSFLDTVYDNCDTEPFVYFVSEFTDYDCDSSGFAGVIDITFYATDDYGNTRQCSQSIFLEKFPVDSVDFPNDTVINCDGANTDPAVIGGPTINGHPITHLCDVGAWKVDQLIPICSGEYKIRRQWWVMDWCTNEQRTDIQYILVTDTIAPDIDCPTDITIGTSMFQCSGTYTFPDPDVTDMCSDDATIDVRFTLSTVPGMFFTGQQRVLPLGPHIVTVRATDDCNNTATCQYTVTVVDNVDPSLACNNVNVTLNAMGMTFLNANSGAFNATDNCGIALREIRRMDDNCNTPDNLVFGQQVKFCCEDVGEPVMVIFQVTDNAGNMSTCMIQVNVKDPEDPVALCRDACVSLGPDGTVTVPPDSIDAGSTDNCEIVSRTVTPNTFDCDDIGFQVVVLTVSDASGNTATCTATVEVKDDEPPVAVCQDITVSLDEMGMVTITTDQIDNGSSDNCGIDTMFLTQYDFDCDDVGTQTVELIVVDAYGNRDTCEAMVTIEDMPPMVFCMDVTVYLDENGQVTITPDDVDGVSDDCSMPTREVIPDMFDCDDLGPNIVVLIATDDHGNTASCTAEVTVVDTIAPECIALDLTVQLGPDGTVTIDQDALDGGSTDNCSVMSITIDPGTFTCDDTGAPVIVVQTVTDQSGNSSTCTGTVTVEDDIAPTCLTQDLTVELDVTGMVVIDHDALDGGSTDNCGIQSIVLDQTAFDCDDVGVVVVVQTVTDVNGNTSTCTASVTIEDNVAPECLTQDITIELDAAGMASIANDAVDDGSNDACGISSIIVTPTTFDCDDVGVVVVVQTVTDVNGNTSTCTASVTVVDSTAPTCSTMDITVELGPDGTVSIEGDAVDDGSADNCGILMIEVDPNEFDCNSDDIVVVIQTVTDVNGNTSTCTANVTVIGGDEPEAFCMDITVYLDENGEVSIAGEDVDDGSFSLCGALEYMVDPSDFTCDDIGPNPVTLTVTDVTGSTATCTAIVTVLDTIAPVCLTQDITVYLDENGEASITVDDVDIGTTDNCALDTIFISQMDFSCEDIGVVVIGKTAIDESNNMAIDSPAVTVVDTLPPTCVTQDITVQINGGGMVVITPDQVDNGSSDNCGTVVLTVEPDTFTCDDLGDNVVILTVTDGSNNTSTCTATVTVEDPGILEASCQNLSVFLDANGMVVIDAVQVDNGSGGGCFTGDIELELSQTVFTCSDVGVNVVTLTVTDDMGNTATCTATITVGDNLPPSIVCPSAMMVNCDVVIDIDNLSPMFGTPTASDNCPPVMVVETVQDNRDICGVGTIVRTFVATDPSGNTAQCSQTITVGDSGGPFGEDDIAWPPMVVNLGPCSSTDPGPGNQPIVDAGTCPRIGIFFDDINIEMTVDNDPNTPCIVITRMWTVHDTCQFQDGTQNGIFTFTQTIIFNDNVGPVFTPLNDVTVVADTVTCTRFVSLVTSATDCGMTTTVTNDFNGGGGNASGEFPIGVTTVIFTSTDACGNVSTMDVVVTVVDGDPPSIMCHKIIRFMTEELEIEVNAEEFVDFSPGSCTDIEDYLFSYSPTNEFDSLRIFGCQFAGSVEPVMIYTFDIGGNPIDTCRGDLDFRDTMDLCGQGLTLTGMLFGENLARINGVPVLISEQSMTTAYTDDKGRYRYRELEEGGTYVIAPYDNDDPREGVSTLDLVAIQKHLLGYKPLSSPYKLIAADANSSGTVTALDLIEIRRLLLNQIQSFPHNTSWRFVDARFEFPDPENPWTIPFPEQMRFDSVQEHMTHKDFIGIKVGDVNNTVFQLQPGEIDVRSGEALTLTIEDRIYRAGEEIEVPFHLSGYSDLLGYQFALRFNPVYAEFSGVSIPDNSVLSADWFGLTDTREGRIAALWYEAQGRDATEGEELFTVSLVAMRDVRLSELFHLDEIGLSPEAYTDAGGHTIPVRLKIGGMVSSPEFQVFQNVPNPFANGTIIPVQLPEASVVQLEVFALDGRLIYSVRKTAEAGYMEFNVNAEDLEQAGIYYYTISTDQFRGTRKMILLE